MSEEKRGRLESMTFRDYLLKVRGLSPEVLPFFQTVTHDEEGLGIDVVLASRVLDQGLPVFEGAGLSNEGEVAKDPYIYHFPDGNASLARLLVRALNPSAVPSSTASDDSNRPSFASRREAPAPR